MEKSTTMKIKKLNYISIILAAAISMAGCENATNNTNKEVPGEYAQTTDTVTIESSQSTEEIASDTGRILAGFPLEENASTDTTKRKTYPYVVKTQSAIWYLAADDIELMGEENFFAGLEEILTMQDADFADARDVLKDYIHEEVAPVEIYTDFCKKAEISDRAGAYCHPVSHFIKVFGDWKQAEASLLHEYVHYLTSVYTSVPNKYAFTSEGIAEYISMLVCENRMCKKANYSAPEEYLEVLRESEFWNAEEDCLEIKNFYYSMTLPFANGEYIGHNYQNINLDIVTRTEEMQQNMHANDCSYQEAGCITAYLAETYGLNTVMANLNKDLMTMTQEAYGKEFSEIYQDFTVWLNEKYEAYENN